MTVLSNHFETLARIGYGARGVVYLLLGGLSLSSAIAGTMRQDDTEGALGSLLGAPMGRVALALIAAGLVGHLLWRFAQAILNADQQPRNAKGYTTRAFQFVSGLVNGALAFTAARLAFEGHENGSGGNDSAIAALMSQPFGSWIVGIAGVLIVGAGLVQLYRGVSRKYARWIVIPPSQRGILDPICRFGLSARGALLALIGGLVIFAAYTVSPSDAGGLRDALSWLVSQPFGWLLYGVAALGLAAFGGYSLIEAFHRRIDAPDGEDIKDAIPG